MKILNKDLQKKIITIRNDISETINRILSFDYKAYSGIDSELLKSNKYQYSWWGIINQTDHRFDLLSAQGS